MQKTSNHNFVACQQCHSRKLKCSGGTPCERCRSRRRECEYPRRERLITVLESYVQELEREVQAARASTKAISSEVLLQDENVDSKRLARLANDDTQNLGDSSAEKFGQIIRELSAAGQPVNLLEGCSSPVADKSAAHYTYSRLKFDFLQPRVSFKLPPRPYAFQLLDIFEEGFCDYHWFLRRQFRDRLALTYSNPQAQVSDRNWLCKVSVVLALAETWLYGRASNDNADGAHLENDQTRVQTNQPSPTPPGAEFFEQGLLLLRPSPEEPEIGDVEVLNLMAFYSYALNRRRTAYSYAMQAVAIGKLSGINELKVSDKPSHVTRIQSEHKKRLWWTSYCMAMMTSTELSVSQESTVDWSQPPLSEGLGSAGLEEFFPPDLLTAQAQLCFIKFKVVETAAQGLPKTLTDATVARLQPCLDIVESWRKGLPKYMSFSFKNGLDPQMLELPFIRILASLYLRYHQCLILLLRPFFLRELSTVIRKAAPQDVTASAVEASPVDAKLLALKSKCLQAAKNNCRILLALREIGKIAKYGYWESLHLFSGLTILALSQVVRIPIGAQTSGQSPATPETDAPFLGLDDDPSNLDSTGIYVKSKALLKEMEAGGNPASKDHMALLSEVETLVDRIKMDQPFDTLMLTNMYTAATQPGAAASDVNWDEQWLSEVDWGHLMNDLGHDGAD